MGTVDIVTKEYMREQLFLDEEYTGHILFETESAG